jgi:hypothetical protein
VVRIDQPRQPSSVSGMSRETSLFDFTMGRPGMDPHSPIEFDWDLPGAFDSRASSSGRLKLLEVRASFGAHPGRMSAVLTVAPVRYSDLRTSTRVSPFRKGQCARSATAHRERLQRTIDSAREAKRRGQLIARSG